LLAGLVVGVLVSVVQSATQIQEVTLTFIPKMLAMMGIMFFFSGWMLDALTGFFTEILTNLDTWGTM